MFAPFLRFLVACLLVLLLTRPVQALSLVNFEWGAVDAAGQLLGFTTADGVTPLPNGSVVQLLWAGPNGQIDPPLMSSGDPGGDDELVDSNNVQNGFPFPPPLRNKGYVSLKVFTYDSSESWHGGQVYMRVWNASGVGSIGGSTAYGESALTTLSDGASFNQLGISTNKTVTAVTMTHYHSQPAGEATGRLVWGMMSLLGLLTGWVWLKRPGPAVP